MLGHPAKLLYVENMLIILFGTLGNHRVKHCAFANRKTSSVLVRYYREGSGLAGVEKVLSKKLEDIPSPIMLQIPVAQDNETKGVAKTSRSLHPEFCS